LPPSKAPHLPDLSRQIRDLEQEVGVQLMNRSARDVELTSAGKAFLNHARMALLQAEAAKEATRQMSSYHTADCILIDGGYRAF
jgi:DNA-binding transcriptional LysR family regulator